MPGEQIDAPYVMHAPTGVAAVDDAVRRAAAGEGAAAALGVLAVTDTLKTTRMTPTGAIVDATIDRSAVRAAVGPLVLTRLAVGTLDRAFAADWATRPLPALVAALRDDGLGVVLVDVAPPA